MLRWLDLEEEFLSVAEVQVFDQSNRNVAKGKDAVQSSNYTSNSWELRIRQLMEILILVGEEIP